MQPTVPPTPAALEIHGLVKRFDRPAVDGLELTVRTGEFYALVGPNGAGKTTTLRMMAGLLRPDAGTIRIGAPSTQSKAFVAGIYGTPLTGSAVYVTSSGQLGVLGSSERFKTDIAPMPELSDKLKRLRPVTFRYKTDPQAIRQYGLIAEEVDQVYPELVIRDEAGKIQGVRYEELAPMLLNEVQQQAAEIRDLKKLVVEMQAGLLKLQAKEELVTLQKDQLVAQR